MRLNYYFVLVFMLTACTAVVPRSTTQLTDQSFSGASISAALLSSSELSWETYSNGAFKFSLMHPLPVFVEDRSEPDSQTSGSYIRLQNYDPYSDRMNLLTEEYYLEIHLSPLPGFNHNLENCKPKESNRVYSIGNYSGYRSLNAARPEYGDAGGFRQGLCIASEDYLYQISVTTSPTNSELGSKILDSFKISSAES